MAFTSYITVAEADAYFATAPNGPTWAALSTEEKETALTAATRQLETLCWKGEVCDAAQLLAWPRAIEASGCCPAIECSVIPSQLVMAEAELALALHQNPNAIIGGSSGAAAGTYVSKQKLGDLEVEYRAFPAMGGMDSYEGLAKAPLLVQKFPWLKDLLQCFATLTPSRLIPVVRN
jgi:hypothetical protein